MLRATRRLWGILPAITGRSTGAAAACDAVLSRPLAVEDCRRHSSVIGAQNAETEPVDESWWREVQGAADGSSGSGGGAEQHPQQQHSRQTRYSNTRLEAPIDAPRALRDYQKMVLALSRRRRCGRCCVATLPLCGVWRVARERAGEQQCRQQSLPACLPACLPASRRPHLPAWLACWPALDAGPT